MSLPPLRLLGISGSLRRQSTNTGLLRAASLHLPPYASLQIADIDFELYSAERDEAGRSEKINRFTDQVEAADGLLFACPEYNYGITGVLKNAIDWASRPTKGKKVGSMDSKPFAVLGAGGGMGSGRAQYALRTTMCYLGGIPVIRPEIFVRIFEAPAKFDKDGNLIDPTVNTLLKQLTDTLVDHVIVNREKEKAIAAYKEKLQISAKL